MPATILEPETIVAATLNASQLCRRCDPRQFPFTTTAELPDSPLVFGQDRAVAAIEFGIGMRRDGYNLFALGPTGAGKHAVVRKFLEEQAASEPPARDWCYVHHFEQPHRPRAISLPKTMAATFRDDIARLVDELRTAISAALETEEYRQHHQQIHEEFSTRRDQALEDLRKRAAERGVALIRTPLGLALAPMREEQVVDADAFQQLPESERRRIRASIEEFEAELEKILHEVPKWHRETHEKLRALKHAATKAAVDALIEELKKAYEGEVGVQSYLVSLEKDVINNADDFRRPKEGEEEASPLAAFIAKTSLASPLSRYQVNVLEDHGPIPGAPVVYEDKPTFHNLIGRIEHVAHMGTLVTDFTHIKGGALHKANGGYLILDARRLLLEPFAWEGLKRALRAHAVRIESLGEALSLVSTVSLDVEPIPLDVKVVLVGDRLLYYLLYEFDPDFRELFKVAVDFEPLSLSASIVFEQSYGSVEGDSASSAELYALLSALADVPLRQSIAVTGSINQYGAVQPVGGINEKIEGFFDVCQAKGRSGDQGVLIPAANMRHLMLRDDVVRAVEAGTFHIYAADTIDQGVEILTGVPAGVRNETGRFPEKSINGLVEQRLTVFAKQARAFRMSAAESKA